MTLPLPPVPAMSSTSAWDLIAFDFDGTLADSFSRFVQVHNQLAARHGLVRIEAADLPALRRMDSRQLLAALEVPRWRVPLLMFQARRLFASQPPVELFPGVLAALRQLRAAGIPLALVTSNSASACRAALGPAWELFDAHCCGIGLHGKARRLARLARRLQVPPARLLYVGDQGVDAEAAAAAGCAFAAVSWGYASIEALRGHPHAAVLDHPGAIAALAGAPA